MIVNQLIKEEKSLSSFRTSVRGNVRALWNGTFGRFDFIDGMRATIELGFRQAWAEGAAQCGISLDELSNEEREKLESMTNSQFLWLSGFADDVIEKNKASGNLLQPLFNRANMWVNRYNEVRNQARVMACGNKKLVWRLGPTEEHCSTCSKMNGKVKRAIQWAASPIKPQSPSLECRGFNCRCTLEPTDEPLSKGPLPKG